MSNGRGFRQESLERLPWLATAVRARRANLAAVMAAVDADFVDEVTRDLRPGMTAVIVEANEGSTRPIDDIVALGGRHVHRQEAAQV